MKSKPSEIDTLVPAAEQRIEFLKIELKKAEEELARLNREKESAPRLNIICEQNDLFSSKSPADGVGKGISVIPETRVNRDSCLPDKIMLIRSLFRVRTDVFARRWESSKTGKSGFLPACANEWVRGVCRKPEVKCGDCPAREFLPLSDSVIEKHLVGYEYEPKRSWGNPRDFTIGIYPLFPDENCWFLAADFDGPTWAQDIVCFRDCARRHGVPVAIERSRSGQGAHAWIFFDEAVPAITARRLGTFLLTQTLDERPEVGFKSYDRLFPNQDFMPEGGFGNLIVLPLQGRAAEHGNTLFLDDGLQPNEDQWAFLSSRPKISKVDTDRIVEEARRLGKILGVRLPASDEDDEEPWKWTPSRKKPDKIIEGPLPRNVKIVLSDLIYVEKADLPPLLRNRLIRLAAFQNPEFYKAQALRLSTFGKPRIISCAEDFSNYIGLPRGCRDEIIDFFSSFGIEISSFDERTVGRPLKVEFKGTLLADQENAFKALAEHDLGVLAAATAFGKTVVAAKMIAERAVNTIVFVHRRQILDQWKNQLSTFLGIPADDIGEIGGGKRHPSGLIDIALIQSLSRDGKVDDIVADYGQIIVDECHHIPAYSFEHVARRCKAKYFLPLSSCNAAPCASASAPGKGRRPIHSTTRHISWKRASYLRSRPMMGRQKFMRYTTFSSEMKLATC